MRLPVSGMRPRPVWLSAPNPHTASLRFAAGLVSFVCCLLFNSLLACLLSASAWAESKILLSIPSDLESVNATTFDDQGRAVGQSSFEIEKDGSGLHRMKIELSVAGGGINRSEATLASVVGALAGGGNETDRLRLTEERSQATRADGLSFDLLVIDHTRGRVSCYPSGGDPSAGRHLDLPRDDRVVNVPLQLLFQPLAAGERESLHFQLALCRDGPVLQDMIASRAPMQNGRGGGAVEIQYGPDFGRAVAWLAKSVLPSFSFWFDANQGGYLAHRMPLHRKGPEILVVRQGFTPPDLGLATD